MSGMEIVEAPLFDEKMKQAQKAAMANRWEDFKKIMKEDKKKLLEQFDLFGNTPIHVATRSNSPQLLRELLEMLLSEDQSLLAQALRKENREGNTVLHEVVFCKKVQMADVVFEYEEKLQPCLEEERKGPLLDSKNHKGESPIFRAAKYGKLKMLKHLANYMTIHNMGGIRKHLHRRIDNYSALHASVIGQHFDGALWLVRKDKSLALEKDKNGYTCLLLLSKMPQVFRSHTPMGLVKSLIYHLLPEEGYEIEYVESLHLFKQSNDQENGNMDKREHPKSVISKINYGFWKRFAKEFDGIDHMWQQKKKHKLAECLADILVQYDLSWQNSYNGKKKTLIAMPPLPFNVAKRRKQIESKRLENDEQENLEESLKYNYTPLLLAASTGIVEIVEKILDLNPEAISHVSHDEQNILHMAIKHRQKTILRIIKRKNAVNSLVPRITREGRTILHQVARMDYYKGGHLAGVAFQLQDELRWYDRVRKIVPHHFYMHCDKYGQTADDVLDIEHDEMLKNAQKWLKETAQSCSTVAVLVANVVFAAAYTIPGGSKGGTPVFLRSPVFLFFSIMDVVALATSLASVVMFLSILTSPCELWDFHKSLPRKLNMGFALLFLSLMTTMLAFSATMLLTTRLEWKNWTSTLIYSAAFFPVTVFGIIQFPLYVMAENAVKQIGKQMKNSNNTTSSEINTASVSQSERPSDAPLQLSTSFLASASVSSGKNGGLDVGISREDEMEEEAPETSNATELSLGSLGGFGIGSPRNTSMPKSNPTGGSFNNVATSLSSSSITFSVPNGELFRPASFTFSSPQSSAPTQSTNSGAFSGGFGVGAAATAQAPSAFGQPAQIGSGQQVLGSVLGTFGQSRQLGSGLPGSCFVAAPTGFGGGFAGSSSTSGLSNATVGGGFAGIASTGGGFAEITSTGSEFSGFASLVGGFAGAASTGGGFAAAPTGAFTGAVPTGFGSGFAGAVSTGGGFAAAPTGAFTGAVPTGFGSGFAGSSSASGFSNAAIGGGFAGIASTGGGFTGITSTGSGFSGFASPVGGFAGAASTGSGFAAALTGGFAGAAPTGFWLWICRQ